MEQTPQNVRVRFAPSPTGYVHIGSLRTVLFNFLFARHSGGKLILRVEDTDRTRLVDGAVENLLSVMHTMGINFDEGPQLKDGLVIETGEFGPYVQSVRKEKGIYQKHIDQLITMGSAYYCFCSSERLDELRKEQTALKKPPMYDRHCRNLSTEEIEKKMTEFKAAGKTPVVRQAIPLEGKTVINDLIYGEITYEHSTIDDQVLLKSDGYPTYHLAVVVDDHHMQISHIIRAQEWIPSTPKHILLFQAFGWNVPLFAHLPLVLNPDKSKLSKRQGDVAVEDFLTKGYLKQALINFIVFLGWNPKTQQEIFTMEELVSQFELTHVNKAAAVFDVNKLDWVNGLYIRTMDITALTRALIPYWVTAGYIEDTDGSITVRELSVLVSIEYLESIAGLEQERLKKLSEIGERTGYFFKEPIYEASILTWKKADSIDAKAKLTAVAELLSNLEPEQFTKENLESEIKGFITYNSYDTGAVLWPLRVALTGMQASPGPFEVASTLALGLGKNEVIKRIKNAAAKIL